METAPTVQTLITGQLDLDDRCRSTGRLADQRVRGARPRPRNSTGSCFLRRYVMAGLGPESRYCVVCILIVGIKACGVHTNPTRRNHFPFQPLSKGPSIKDINSGSNFFSLSNLWLDKADHSNKAAPRLEIFSSKQPIRAGILTSSLSRLSLRSFIRPPSLGPASRFDASRHTRILRVSL